MRDWRKLGAVYSVTEMDVPPTCSSHLIYSRSMPVQRISCFAATVPRFPNNAAVALQDKVVQLPRG